MNTTQNTDTTTTQETTMREFPSFYEWINQDEDRRQDYAYEAIGHLDTCGMTAEVSKIIRDHADSAAYDFTHSVDAEDINARAVDDFMDGYEFETYHGPDRAALIHWAWNSNMDITEFGPLSGENVWEQIEHITRYQINGAARQALAEYADKYEEAREEWEAEQEEQEENTK